MISPSRNHVDSVGLQSFADHHKTPAAMTKHDIIVYTDARTATGSLHGALRQEFGAHAFNLRTVDIADIRAGVLRTSRARLFVWPGIVGEHSLYPHHFGTHEIDEIYDFVSGRGHVALMICAAAYFMSRETHYQSASAGPKFLQSARPFFNGAAIGVVPSLRGTGHGAHMLAPINFRNVHGHWEDAHICYGNGPALIPDDPNDPDMEVIATYRGEPNNPAAMLRLNAGRGTVYMSGIHPEIGFIPISSQQNAPTLHRARAFNQLLHAHEHERRKVWTMLTARIKQDIQP